MPELGGEWKAKHTKRRSALRHMSILRGTDDQRHSQRQATGNKVRQIYCYISCQQIHGSWALLLIKVARKLHPCV